MGGGGTLGISTILEYLELYSQSLKTTKSDKQDGESLFKILSFYHLGHIQFLFIVLIKLLCFAHTAFSCS
jgi:hypothetical protein